MSTYDEVIDKVIARLAGVAPCARGTKGIGRNTSPPYIVFQWLSIDNSSATRIPDFGDSCGSTNIIQYVEHRFDVHIWGKKGTGGGADLSVERMLAAVLSALNLEVLGRRWVYEGADVEEGADDTLGAKLTAHMLLRLGLTEIFVPAPTPAATPGKTDTTTTLQPATLPVVVVTSIDDDTSITPTLGDGILETGET